MKVILTYSIEINRLLGNISNSSVLVHRRRSVETVLRLDGKPTTPIHVVASWAVWAYVKRHHGAPFLSDLRGVHASVVSATVQCPGSATVDQATRDGYEQVKAICFDPCGAQYTRFAIAVD